MQFSKMHGLGNDFIVVGMPESRPDSEWSRLAVRLCDRHFGIGGDGILLALPSEKADFRMRLFNSDGSEAAHCGNGIRCLAKYLFDHGHTDQTELTIETIGRVNVLQLHVVDGNVETVRVDLGDPIFKRGAIPVRGDADSEFIDEPLSVGEATERFTCVSMGNPHAVAFVDDAVNFPVLELGPLFEKHPAFPDRANIEFVQVVGPEELIMRVWERGAGPTLACGTGACASLVASARTGLTHRRATVHLTGGDLDIEWGADNHVYMTGPAVEAYTGTVAV